MVRERERVCEWVCECAYMGVEREKESIILLEDTEKY